MNGFFAVGNGTPSDFALWPPDKVADRSWGVRLRIRFSVFSASSVP
jgi:hypothetical protein